MPLSRINSASIANSAISAADIADGTITAIKIISVANTQITGNIVSSQITSVGGSQITANTIANSAFQTGSVENYMSAAGLGFGMRNRIINGAMVIDQRNAGSVVTPANASYTLDRWICFQTTASKYSVQQQTSVVPTGFTYAAKITSLSSYSVLSSDYYTFQQKIEGYNIADLGWGTANAKTVTLSFWVYSSLTGTFGGSFFNPSGTRSYPFTYTISTANTWEQKSVTIAGDTSGTWPTVNDTGIILAFTLGVGSTGAGPAGAWASAFYLGPTGATSVVGTNGATFYITGVQLEKGSTATSFDYRPFGTELQLCQKYFTKSQSWAAAVTAGEGQGLIAWYAVTTSIIAGWASHKVSMRTQPTITIYRQDGTVNATNRFTDGVNTTGTATCPEPGIEGFRYVSNASSGFTVGTYYQFYYIASAEL